MYRHVQPCRTEDSGRAKRGISSEANGCELYIKSRAASEHQKVNYQRLIGHLMNRRYSHAAEAVLAASDTEDLPIEGVGPARPPSNPSCLGLTSRGIRVRVVRSFSVGPSNLFPTYSTTISSLFGSGAMSQGFGGSSLPHGRGTILQASFRHLNPIRSCVFGLCSISGSLYRSLGSQAGQRRVVQCHH
jgi:hypothetical protein